MLTFLWAWLKRKKKRERIFHHLGRTLFYMHDDSQHVRLVQY